MNILYTFRSLILVLTVTLSSSLSIGQLIIDSTATATQLANEIVGSGVSLSNVSLQSASGGSGLFSNGNNTNIGISNGILLTTGNSYDAVGPNLFGNTTKDKSNFTDDPDLDNITAYSIEDQCILQFDFVPTGNYIHAQYVFASEEYDEWVCTRYNDLFGFFVTGPNPAGGTYNSQNIALVPGTNLPVSINTINNGTIGSHGNSATCVSLDHSSYYQSNTLGLTIGYDGFTVNLSSYLQVTPGQTYHFKFAIADISDGKYDSGIFIKADSFSSYQCDSGNISFTSTPPNFCSDDAIADVVNVQNNSTAPTDTYTYLLTNSTGVILATSSTGSFDLANYGTGTFKIYGLSTEGTVTGVNVGNNITAINANSSSGCFSISTPLTVSRQTCNPVLTCPPNQTVQCLTQVPLPNLLAVQVVSQNCLGGLVTWVSDQPSGNSCQGTITRTYQLTDLCGNTGQCQQTFTYHDTTPPVIGSPGINLTISCAEFPIFTPPIATDNCGIPTIEEVSDVTVPGIVPGTYTRTKIWRAVDACGNVSNNVGQAISIQDVLPPILVGVPIELTVNCGELPTGSSFGVIATDLCDPAPTVTSDYTDTQDGCQVIRNIIWTATDASGNIATATRTFIAVDIFAPILFGVPLNITSECGDTEPIAVVTATDNCDQNPTVTLETSILPLDCGESLIRTWTAVDLCGNTSTQVQITLFVDTTDPTLIGLPAGGNVTCMNLPLPADFNVVANDNCSEGLTMTSSFIDSGSGCNITRVITWVATDACGNTFSASRTFVSGDNIAPQLIGVPDDAIQQCGEPVPDAIVSAIDNCDPNIIVSLHAVTVPATCGYSLVRTWTATDSCGNSTSQTQTTTFEDTNDPTLIGLPDGGVVNCGAIPDGEDFDVTTTDNCINALTVTSSYVDQGSGCNITRVITWTASDACGNSSSASRIFTTTDSSAPVLAGMPNDATVSCGSLPSGDDFAVFANDNCDPAVSITFSESDQASGCNVARTITWTATDNCGNSSSASRTFTSSDVIAPQLIGVPADATLQCGQPVPDAVVSAIDNCDPNPSIGLSATTVPATCGYSLVRTWTVVDACGNTTSQSQTTTFEDTTDPVLVGLPDDGTVNCGSVPDGEDFEVTATDNCINAVTVTSSFVDQGSGCNVTRVITWTATDACGNSATATRTFTSTDTSAPVLAGMPNDATVSCGSLPSGDDFAVFANDNCDPAVSITFSESDQASGCNVARTITWTATDICGNSSSASRTFTSSDVIAPQLIGVPADATLQCGQPVPDAVVSAIDNCDPNPSIGLSASTVPATCGYSLVRTWTVVDACGNTSSQSQTTTFEDTTDPALVGLPTGGQVNCGALPDGDDFDVTTTDNCINIVTIASSYVDQGSGCNITRVITWTATDACGNSVSDSRTFSTNDTEPPILVGIPENGSVLCGGLPASTEYFVSANDNCDQNVNITVVASDSGAGCNVVRTLTWTATDDCGNSATATRTFTTQDNIAPQLIGVPADATLQCGQPVPDAVVSAIDNCDLNLSVGLSATTVPATCGYSLVRTWTVVDACGNTTSQSQTTTFEDTTDPVLVGLPDDGTVNCGSVPDGEDFEVTATDNCINAVTVTSSFVDQGSGCNVTRVITWTATDACGNSATATRTFTSTDTSAPVLAGMPNDATVSCGSLPSGDDFAVFANDNCDPAVSITFSESDQASGCNVARTITWTATDNCGNSSSASRTFTSSDVIAPQLIGVPADVTLQCGQSVPDAVVSAIDNCDPNPSVGLSVTTVPSACGYSLIRTWTSVDACGNDVSQSQTTIFIDTTSPVLEGLPDNMTVACISLPNGDDYNVSATDNCDATLIVTSSQFDEGIGCNVTRTITWTCTDACGNTTHASRVFSASDMTPPAFVNLPNDAELSCGDMPDGNSFSITATDDCDASVTISSSIEDISQGCQVLRTITWTAIDDCGNTVTASRTFTSIDNEPPVMIGVPQDVTVNCGASVPVAVVEAFDNCDFNLSVQLSANTMETECGYALVRTWTVTDACGNSTSASQTTHFTDNVAPVLHGVPVAATFGCGSIPDAGSYQVSATDNCDQEVIVEFIIQQDENICGSGITITWTATDDCGNVATASRTFGVSDNIAPVLHGNFQELTFECDDVIPENNVWANDNCDDDVAITITDLTEVADCYSILNRTWTATDNCGNTTQRTQVIYLLDETSPTFSSIPQNVTVDCGSIPAAPEIGVTDNCDSSPSVQFSESVMSSGCPYMIKRIWTASDACGNTNVIAQIITVTDLIAPQFVGFNPQVEVECDALNSYVPQVSDNCGTVQPVLVSETTSPAECGEMIQRTYSATDQCGNTTTVSQQIHVTDSTPPLLHGIPNETFIQCGQDLPEVPSNIIALDNCTPDLNIEFSQTQSGTECPYIVTRTWTATDECGNTTSQSQVIHIINQVEASAYFRVYPNPGTASSVRIQFSVAYDSPFQGGIYDGAGRLVVNLANGIAEGARVYEWREELNQLAPGSYVVKMIAGGKTYNKQFNVIR